MVNCLVIIALILAFCVLSVFSTALDDYVNLPDPHYNYELIHIYKLTGYSLFILNLTSQKWYDESLSSQPIWWHYLCISVPDVVTKPDAAFFLIDGGSNTDGLPKPTDNFLSLVSIISVSTGAVGAQLQQVPNQPIVFWKDASRKQRYEDAVVAWTWKIFMEDIKDPFILLRLPMTKAAVRGMDAVTEFTRNKGFANIKRFMVAGASKRGWTAWTTAAVDDRVFATVPIVLDILNMNNNLHHHYRSLGGWTFAFEDYYQVNITSKLDTLELQALEQIIDPLSYLDRYANTKIMLINTAGDEFFLPDDPDYFWNNLLVATNGTVMLRRIANAEHSLVGHEISIFFTMRSFFLSVYSNAPLPDVKWTRPNNSTHGIIIVTVDTRNGVSPFDVTAFHARTIDNKRRDFRLAVKDPNGGPNPVPHPVLWLSDRQSVRAELYENKMVFTVAYKYPSFGWFAFYLQLSFNGLDDSVLELTSETNIIPEIFPFNDCYREECFGVLV